MPKDTDKRFGSLRTLGKIVRVLGIIVALINAVWFLWLMAETPDSLMIFAAAAIAFLFSLAIVAFGEMVVCFVAIEHNTRHAAEGIASMRGGEEDRPRRDTL